MDLRRCSFRSLPSSAAGAAVWMGKEMGCNGPRGLKPQSEKQDGILKNKMAALLKMSVRLRLCEVGILSGRSILLTEVCGRCFDYEK